MLVGLGFPGRQHGARAGCQWLYLQLGMSIFVFSLLSIGQAHYVLSPCLSFPVLQPLSSPPVPGFALLQAMPWQRISTGCWRGKQATRSLRLGAGTPPAGKKKKKKSKWNFFKLKKLIKKKQPKSFRGRGVIGDIPACLPARLAADALSDGVSVARMFTAACRTREVPNDCSSWRRS